MIKELLLVREWYALVADELSLEALWYTKSFNDGFLFAKQEKIGDIESRNKSLRDGIRRLCKRARIYYHSPHKFRRGHGVYTVKNSRNLEEFQVYSQNMGHDDPGTTFKFYSKLSNNDIREVILGNRKKV